MKQAEINEIIEAHAKWLRGDGGKRANLTHADLTRTNLIDAKLQGANLTDANLHGANLTDANLTRANLYGADLRGADLYGAKLRGAKLHGADLRGANLSDAYLSGAYLSGANLHGANLTDANLTDANLRGAYLSGANLSGAYLLCFGNLREIKTLQIDTWQVGYTANTLQVGCQRHSIEKWRKWTTPAGRKWVEQMDGKAIGWADKHLALVLQIIDASPATPTGHEQ